MTLNHRHKRNGGVFKAELPKTHKAKQQVSILEVFKLLILSLLT